MTRLVHWYEGMFMRVQSLQAMQQGLLERVEDLRRYRHHYAYGVIEAKISREKLQKGRVRCESLRAVLRSGLEVVVPEDCQLDELSVCEEITANPRGEVLIYLGVPDYSTGHPNAFRTGETPDARAKIRYIPGDETRADENTGDNKQTILVRTLNARLLFEHEFESNKAAGLECLPLMRVRRASATGGLSAEFPVEPVSSYVPPCLFIPVPESIDDARSSSPSAQSISLPGNLAELIRLAATRVEVTRETLARRLKGQGLNMAALQGTQFKQWIRLLALSRHAGRLLALQQSPNTTPFEMFLALNEALCELEALQSSTNPKTNPPLKYDHDNCYRIFEQLGNRLDKAMQDVEGVATITADFVPDARRPEIVSATLSPEFFADNVAILYLTIETTIGVGELQRAVEDRSLFELTVPRQLGQGLGGLQLRHEPSPPAGLPEAPGLHYFRVEQSGNSFHQLLWDKVKTDRQLSATRQSPNLNLSAATLKLYATLRPKTVAD